MNLQKVIYIINNPYLFMIITTKVTPICTSERIVKLIRFTDMFGADRIMPVSNDGKLIRRDIEYAIDACPKGTFLDLAYRNLQNIDLSFLNLCGANFRCANMYDSTIIGANVCAADFAGAYTVNLKRNAQTKSHGSNLESESIIFSSNPDSYKKTAMEMEFSLTHNYFGIVRVEQSIENDNHTMIKLAPEVKPNRQIVRNLLAFARFCDITVDMSGMFLSGLDMSGMDFSYVKFVGTYFISCNMAYSNFKNADMFMSHLGVNLYKADIGMAKNLEYAKITYVLTDGDNYKLLARLEEQTTTGGRGKIKQVEVLSQQQAQQLEHEILHVSEMDKRYSLEF